MSLADGLVYEVIEGHAFAATWREVVRGGLIHQMVAPAVLAGIKDHLRTRPHAVQQIPTLPVDVRRIVYQKLFAIWYSICEDDSTVCLEEVTRIDCH